jgi:hypothetical protein
LQHLPGQKKLENALTQLARVKEEINVRDLKKVSYTALLKYEDKLEKEVHDLMAEYKIGPENNEAAKPKVNNTYCDCLNTIHNARRQKRNESRLRSYSRAFGGISKAE